MIIYPKGFPARSRRTVGHNNCPTAIFSREIVEETCGHELYLGSILVKKTENNSLTEWTKQEGDYGNDKSIFMEKMERSSTRRSLLGIPSKREEFIQPSVTSQFPKLTALSGRVGFVVCEREREGIHERRRRGKRRVMKEQ